MDICISAILYWQFFYIIDDMIFVGKSDKDELHDNDSQQQRGQADGREPGPGHERPHARF